MIFEQNILRQVRNSIKEYANRNAFWHVLYLSSIRRTRVGYSQCHPCRGEE